MRNKKNHAVATTNRTSVRKRISAPTSESLDAVIERFADAASALHTHPDCPLAVRDNLALFDVELFNESRDFRIDAERERETFGCVLKATLRALAVGDKKANILRA